MIKVKFERIDDGKTFILTVDGHAGQAEKGKDIICASASILALTVAECVNQMHKAKRLKKKPTIKLEDGSAIITCKPQKDSYGEALHLFLVAQVGYALLNENYPDFVDVTLLA